ALDDDEIGMLLVRRHAAAATVVAGTLLRGGIAVERHRQLARQGALADLRGSRDEVGMRQCPGRHGALEGTHRSMVPDNSPGHRKPPRKPVAKATGGMGCRKARAARRVA